MVASRNVHKKASLNGKITLFLEKREIKDYITHVEPIVGVVVINEDQLKKTVYGQVLVTFRYGRKEDETLGLHFSKDLFLVTDVIYPQGPMKEKPTKLQKKLLDKYGPNAFPFSFQIGKGTPQSVILNPFDEGKQCGVFYKIRVYTVDGEGNSRPSKRHTVEMALRKIQWAPIGHGKQPCCVIRKDFMFSPGEIELEATLDKPMYMHGDNIVVTIVVQNYSSKTVKRVVASGHYKNVVAILDTQEGCPIEPGSTYQKTIVLSPTTEENKDGRGIAVDGDIGKEEARLATSTLAFHEHPTKGDTFGIQVSYYVRVKLIMGAIAGELIGELPFLLMAVRAGKQLTSEKV